MKIPKSQIDAAGIADFAVAAQAYAHEVKAWKTHMQRVSEDVAKAQPTPPNLDDFTSVNQGQSVVDQAGFDEARRAYENSLIEFHQPYPAPSSHPLVQSVLNENDEPEFEIVDDGPTPDQKLSMKKRELMHDLTVAEMTALEAVVPSAKHRLLAYRDAEINKKDEEARNRLVQAAIDGQSLIKRAANAVGLGKPPINGNEINAEVVRSRSAEDVKHLEDQDERRKKIEVIQRAAAEAASAIEDLTHETVEGWKVPELKS